MIDNCYKEMAVLIIGRRLIKEPMKKKAMNLCDDTDTEYTQDILI